MKHVASRRGRKISFWGEPNEKYHGQILIKKDYGEDEYFDSTDEPKETNLIMHNNPFIDQEMDYETTIKNDETSETPNGDSEKEKFRKFFMSEQ